jgi:nucleoside-diphosphate-sugar epimerase
VAKLIGGEIEYIPARLEPKDTRADNSLAKKLLGWEPKVKLEDGIAELKKIYGI